MVLLLVRFLAGIVVYLVLSSSSLAARFLLLLLCLLRQVLAQGDMFLNSSVSEGLPLAIIEASRAGLVVVATDVGGDVKCFIIVGTNV